MTAIGIVGAGELGSQPGDCAATCHWLKFAKACRDVLTISLGPLGAV
jgi:hypothetical protein